MDLGKVVVGKLLMDLLMHIPWLLLLDQGKLLAMYLEQNLQLNRLVQVDHKGLNHHNQKHNQNNRLKQLLDRLLNPVVLRLELALPMLLVLLSLGQLPLPRLLVVPGLYL